MPAADSLLALASRTMMGSLYWRDKTPREPTPRRFAQPDMSDVENTLTAYRILRAAGNRKAELEKIRNYFFEQQQKRFVAQHLRIVADRGNHHARHAGEGRRHIPRSEPDDRRTTVRQIPAYPDIRARKGDNRPQRGFHARILHSLPTSLERQTGACGRRLLGFDPVPQGRQARDNTPCRGARRTGGNRNGRFRRRIRHGRDPDPAGCSYDSKEKGDFWKEAHREYYKEKVAVFCNKLRKGTHTFTVRLLPRYTGSYRLNPARAELMYYPVFHGRNEMKKCGVARGTEAVLPGKRHDGSVTIASAT